MISTKLTSIGLAASVAAVLPAVSAQAQVNRTFVSAAGSDSNNCANVLTPCRHFAAAYAVTAPSGEIFVLDPANYGSLTITHAVSIEGHGWASIAPPNNGNAITINAGPSDSISLHGVTIDGTGATGSTTGIVFISGGALEVTACDVRNFTGSGIAFAPTPAGSSTVHLNLSDSVLANNGGHGIYVQPGGSGFVSATFTRVQATNNVDDGIGIYGNLSTNSFLGAIVAVVADSVASGNGTGFHAFTLSGHAAVGLDVSHSAAANGGILNSSIGISADGPNATLRIGQSQVVGNFAGWSVANGGVVSSYGDNYIDDNEANNSAPPSIIARK
jgi:hypothetical protein